MKFPKLAVVFLLSTSILLNGCTALLLQDAENEPTYNYDTTQIGSDNLSALGKLKNSENVVIAGENYWYLIDKDSSKDLLNLFSHKYSLPFVVSYSAFDVNDINDPREYDYAINVILDKSEFSSNFCLNYQIPKNVLTKQTQEIERLKKLDFNVSDKENSRIYSHCYRVVGQLYNSPSSQNLAYKFKHNIPIILKKQIKKYNHKKTDKIVNTIYALPFTVALDVVFLPISLITLQVVNPGK